MLDIFPHFTKLSLSHKLDVTSHSGRFEPFSDFIFTSLFAWDTDGSTELALLNENLVIRMPDYLDGHMVYSILGDKEIDASLQSLLNITDRLEWVPEIVVKNIETPTMFKVIEDRNNFDYIHSLQSLSEFTGSDLKKKRSRATAFDKAHEAMELVVRTSRTLAPEGSEAIRQLDRKWAEENPRDEGDILSERKALDRLLDHHEDFELLFTEVVVGGSVKAFSIHEALGSGYAVCHFEKALKTHDDNLGVFLVRETAKELLTNGCTRVNWEQDLGLSGLRQSKMSYRPTNFLKKYTIQRTAI